MLLRLASLSDHPSGLISRSSDRSAFQVFNIYLLQNNWV